MLSLMYLGLSLIVLAFLVGLLKLWRVHRRMSAREQVMDTRMMEAAHTHRKEAEADSVPGRPAQGSLWDD
jgi:hypothetical protein